MTLSKVSFSKLLENDFWGSSRHFRDNFDFYTFKNYTFESVGVDRLRLIVCTYINLKY